MLVLQTQMKPEMDAEWIRITVKGESFWMTAKVDQTKKGSLKNRVVAIFDAPPHVEIIRESLIDGINEDNRGNKR